MKAKGDIRVTRPEEPTLYELSSHPPLSAAALPLPLPPPPPLSFLMHDFLSGRAIYRSKDSRSTAAAADRPSPRLHLNRLGRGLLYEIVPALTFPLSFSTE